MTRHHHLRSQRLLPDPASRRHGRARDRLDRRHGACAFGAGDALSLLAGLDARSRRSPAIRMSDALHERLGRGAQIRARACDANRAQARSARAHLPSGPAPHRGAGRAPPPTSTRARPSPSSGRRAPASRRFCTSPACWRRPTAAASSSTGATAPAWAITERTRVRRLEMGFVYQFHQLLPEFSALENVVIPQMIFGRGRRQAAARARQLLGSLGLAERVDHRPAELSGGEQQRTAIARALANSPQAHSRRRADRQPRPAHRRARFRPAHSPHPHNGRRARSSPPTTSSWRGAWTACCASRTAS